MRVDARLRFDNFIVGSGNRLAVAAARAVADAPGAVYNPLFIYSASGLGKTHLICAIGNQIETRSPGAEVEHATLDDIVAHLHAAVASGETDALRRRFEHVTALLIDDMQFLTGHRETQSELLRVLNSLQSAGRQIVMTSDRPPGEIADVDERLVTRLSGGLIVDVGAPDYETRSAILRSKCEERGVRFRPGVVEELARLEFKNVRELQGALNRLIAVQTLGGEQVSPSDVLAVLGDLAEARVLVNPPERKSGEFQVFLNEVASAVAEHVEKWQSPLPAPSMSFTRAGFEVGASNQLAVRAADAVVASPGERYNPLFLHGPSGVGKTHLLNAIGNSLLVGGTAARVAFVSAQTFVDELIAALQNGTVEEWRTVYRSVDALLVDDVQFIADKERTQEELFHVFNTMHAAGKQLAFTSDKPPRELARLADRLRSRFEGGLVVGLEAPDRGLRERLFARLFQERGISLGTEVLNYLAERPAASVRELIGTVNRVIAAIEVHGATPTLAFVRAEIGPTMERVSSATPIHPPEAVLAGGLPLAHDKLVWEWPDPAGRLIEELR